MPHGRKVSVVGPGHDDLQVAVAIGKQEPVIGFDAVPIRIREFESGLDRTREIDSHEVWVTRIMNRSGKSGHSFFACI